jgi:hypothetical protein
MPSGRRHISALRTYILWELGLFRQGVHSFTTEFEVKASKLTVSHRSLMEPEKGTRTFVFTLYINAGNGCLLVESHTERTEVARHGTTIPLQEMPVGEVLRMPKMLAANSTVSSKRPMEDGGATSTAQSTRKKRKLEVMQKVISEQKEGSGDEEIASQTVWPKSKSVKSLAKPISPTGYSTGRRALRDFVDSSGRSR